MAAMNAGVLVPEPNEVPVPAPVWLRWCDCCCFICIFGGLLLLFSSLFLGPDPRGLHINLDSLSVSNLNITDNQISGDWVIGLNISNPNRRTTVVFEGIEYSVAWSGAPDGVIVSGSEAKPVVQPPKSGSAVALKGSAEWLTLSNVLSGDLMRRDVANNGTLAFEISLSGTFRYKTPFSIDDGPSEDFELWSDIRVPLLPSNSTPNTLTGTYHN